jgi:hypothetical protein
MLQEEPSRVDHAFEQVLKGCQLAIQGATILRQENRDLRAANAKTAHRKRRTRRQLAHEGAVSVEEAISLLSGPQIAENGENAINDAASPTPISANKRRLQRCSVCKTPGHKRTRCLGRPQ